MMSNRTNFYSRNLSGILADVHVSHHSRNFLVSYDHLGNTRSRKYKISIRIMGFLALMSHGADKRL